MRDCCRLQKFGLVKDCGDVEESSSIRSEVLLK
jgi:hypothetical protein